MELSNNLAVKSAQSVDTSTCLPLRALRDSLVHIGFF